MSEVLNLSKNWRLEHLQNENNIFKPYTNYQSLQFTFITVSGSTPQTWSRVSVLACLWPTGVSVSAVGTGAPSAVFVSVALVLRTMSGTQRVLKT